MATSSAAPAASASASASAALAGPSQPQPLPPPPTSPVSLASAEARLIRSDFRTLALAARVEQLDRALNLLTSKLVRCSSRVRGINHTDSHARSEAGVASLVASRSATVPPNLELCQRLKLNLPLGPSHGVQLLMRLFFKSAVHRIAQLLHHPTRILSVQRAFENCIEALWHTWVRGEISDNVAIECVGAVVRAIPIAHNYNLYADFLNWISPHVGISQQLSRNIANAEIPIDLIEIFGGPDTSRSRSPNGDVAVFFRERIDALRNNSNLLGNHQIYQHFIDVQQRRLTREWEQSALEFTSLKITFTAVLSTCLSESMSTNEIFSRIASVIPTPNINAGGDSNSSVGNFSKLFSPITSPDANHAIHASSRMAMSPVTPTGIACGTGVRECAICCMEERIPHVPLSTRCKHRRKVCQGCVTRYLRVEIVEKGRTNIPCVEAGSGCRNHLNYEEIRKVADRATFARYDAALLQAAMRLDPEFRWCSRPDCRSGQLTTASDGPIMTCHECSWKTCVSHRITWHEGLTCVEHDELHNNSGNNAKNGLGSKNIKGCPRCKTAIEKNGGCDHMTCATAAGGCGAEFCWLCSALYTGKQGIRAIGNSAHDKKCRHHRGINERRRNPRTIARRRSTTRAARRALNATITATTTGTVHGPTTRRPTRVIAPSSTRTRLDIAEVMARVQHSIRENSLMADGARMRMYTPRTTSTTTTTAILEDVSPPAVEPINTRLARVGHVAPVNIPPLAAHTDGTGGTGGSLFNHNIPMNHVLLPPNAPTLPLPSRLPRLPPSLGNIVADIYRNPQQ